MSLLSALLSSSAGERGEVLECVLECACVPGSVAPVLSSSCHLHPNLSSRRNELCFTK